MNLYIRLLIKRFRESAIPILLLAFVALGWIVALKAHDDQAKDEQYQHKAQMILEEKTLGSPR
jgi:hypothetical protein